MRSRVVRIAASSVLAGAVAITAAGCGSSTTSTGKTGAASTPSATTSGEKQAAAFLAAYTQNPTSIGITSSPLAGKPPSGKTVISLTDPIPVALRQANAQAAAAKVLGWNFSQISTGSTPASAVSAFQAALAKHPDAIIFAGQPASTFTAQIQQAKADGIAVVSNATGDGSVDGVLADLGGLAQEQLYGKMVAAYFVVHSGGKGRVGVFNIAAYPILTDFVDSFQAAVKQWCAACGLQVLNQQVTDVGTRTPANVVAFLQRNPSVKWTVFANGDLAQGVSPALRAGGLTGINIIGEVPSETNIANLKTGAEQAWAGYPVDILGWRVMDVLARHFAGADLTAVLKVQLPVQMITTDNVAQVVLGSQDYYVGVDGYQAPFAKLWHEPSGQ